MTGGFNPPESVIASWPKPNYVDPVTRGYALIICLGVVLVIALLTLAARLWARFVLRREAGLDDLLALFAAMPTIGLSITIALASQKYNFDRHVWDVEPSLRAPASKINWITQLFFLLSTCSIKVSILLFYRRLPPGTHTWLFSCAVLAAIAVIVAYPVAFLLILIFQCQPLDSYWMRFAPDYNGVYQCRTKEAISLPISAYLSTIIDFLVLLLPLWQVQNIKLPRRQKWTLYAIFSLGLVVITAGILRSVYLYRMFYETYDVTWVGYVQMIWTIIENDCALIASCAPSLRPFLIRFLPDATMTPDNNYYVRGPPRKARGFYPPPTTAGIHDYDDTPEPVLPIQTPQEQELASMESRIGSLMQSSRNGSVMSEASQTSYFFDDGRSGTFIASETTASLEEGCAKDWPLPAKSF